MGFFSLVRCSEYEGYICWAVRNTVSSKSVIGDVNSKRGIKIALN